MRKLTVLLPLFTAFWAVAVQAQSGAIHIVCEDCRDPLAHPNDWANFAFNQIYGEDAWLDFDQADDFWIHNLDGDKVYVDVDYVMEGVNVFGNDLPLWPTNLLQITLVLPNGDMLEVLRSVFVTNLPVPSPSGPKPDTDGTGSTDGGGESGDDGVDEPEPGEEEELPEQPGTEVIGTTGIEDPDADGEFSEPDWCEEC